jgi:hypothetical protein
VAGPSLSIAGVVGAVGVVGTVGAVGAVGIVGAPFLISIFLAYTEDTSYLCFSWSLCWLGDRVVTWCSRYSGRGKIVNVMVLLSIFAVVVRPVRRCLLFGQRASRAKERNLTVCSKTARNAANAVRQFDTSPVWSKLASFFLY